MGSQGPNRRQGLITLSGTKDTKILFQPWEWNPNDSKPEYQTEIMRSRENTKTDSKKKFF